jgi:RNA polymerase sigma factor (TIGR02999 family)
MGCETTQWIRVAMLTGYGTLRMFRPMTSPADITQRLRQAQEGDRGALDEVFGLVYDELHRQARAQRRRWSGDHTLDTTALVHEAYLKMVGQPDPSWNDRGHFLAVAARAMRHLLVNYAERRRAAKRGGGADHVSLEDREPGLDSSPDFNPVSEEVAEDLIALHEALERLAAVNERQVRVVEARFYVGLSIDETAQALGISPATVKRDWQVASAWLHREIQSSLDPT